MVFCVWFIGIWLLVFGICFLNFGYWCIVFGVWYLLFAIWFLVYLYLVFGIWYLIFGICIWYLVYGVWYLDNVDKPVMHCNKLIKFRGELHAEVRAKMNAADRDANATDSKVTDRVEALETKVLHVLDWMSTKIAIQDKT